MLNFLLLVVFLLLSKISNAYQQIKRTVWWMRGIRYNRYDDPKTGMYHFEKKDDEEKV